MSVTTTEKPLIPRTSHSALKKFYFFEYAIALYSVDTPLYFLGGMHTTEFKKVYPSLKEDRGMEWNLFSIDQEGVIRSEDSYPPESVEFFCTKGEFKELTRIGLQRHLLSYLFSVVEIHRT